MKGLKILSVLVFLTSNPILAQKVKLMYISLEYSNAIIIGSRLQVEIQNDYLNPKKIGNTAIAKITTYSRKEKKNITKEIIVKEKDYQEICDKILKIRAIDVLASNDKFLDAANTELKFATLDGMVTYDAYALEATDENSSLKDFREAVIKILNSTGQKIRGFNYSK